MANVAPESFHPTMNFDMLVQIRSLSEAEVAVRDWTYVGSFICVDSQMIKEIMPFPKPFITSFMITFENFYVPFRARILVGKNSKLFCVRNMLFYLNWTQIECSTGFNCNHYIASHFIKCFTHFAKLFSSHPYLTCLTFGLQRRGNHCCHAVPLWVYTSGRHYLLRVCSLLQELVYLFIFERRAAAVILDISHTLRILNLFSHISIEIIVLSISI